MHRDKKSLINQREVEVDTKSFSGALRSALRQDPDVILVGEMRDYETIETAITAAETGHLVLSTLHTLDATETINRIIAVFPPHQQKQIRLQLAQVLKAVISLRLLPRADGQGRVPAAEVLVSTALIRDYIINKEKTPHDSGCNCPGNFPIWHANIRSIALFFVEEGHDYVRRSDRCAQQIRKNSNCVCREFLPQAALHRNRSKSLPSAGIGRARIKSLHRKKQANPWKNFLSISNGSHNCRDGSETRPQSGLFPGRSETCPYQCETSPREALEYLGRFSRTERQVRNYFLARSILRTKLIRPSRIFIRINC